MSALRNSECVVSEDFPVQLLLGLELLELNDCQQDDAERRHALRDDDEAVPEMPPDHIAQSRFGPEAFLERVVLVVVHLELVDWEDKDVFGDLTGASLPSSLDKLAKKEELSEMYRRSVWTEVPISQSVDSIGKPPIPVRWVIANKGDKKHYNVRARLVAKHQVSKYGGKGLHE